MAKKSKQNKVSQEVANPNVSSQYAEFAQETAGAKMKKKKNK